MNEATSAYIKEHILKTKFVDTWEKLCKLRGIDPEVVIEDEQTQNYSGTPYPEINRRVQRLLCMDEFPDCFDIVQLIERANTKYSLGISTDERSQLATKVFKEVGGALKKRRHRDFVAHFGSHLTDDFKESRDPALENTTLNDQLQKQQKEGEEKLAHLCEDFACKQDKDGDRTDEGSSGESEVEETMELGTEHADIDILVGEKSSSTPTPAEKDGHRESDHTSAPDGHDQGTLLELPAELPEDIIIITRQKKGVNYRIDNQSSDSEDDFVPSSKKPKTAVGAVTAPKRSSREERQFNKELDSALKASLAAPGTAEVTHSRQQHSTVVDQGPAKVIVTKKETSKEHKPAGPSKGTSREPEPAGPSRCDSKELCTDSNSADPQQRKTTGCVSPSAQSGDDAKEPLSWDEEVNTKSDNEGTSDDSVGKSVSTKAKLKGDKGRIASDPPSRCARDISSKSCIDSTSAKPSGVKATVSAEHKASGTNHSVRVGLSRNIRIKPLHPKLKTVLK
eukprot:Em0016g1083a